MPFLVEFEPGIWVVPIYRRLFIFFDRKAKLRVDGRFQMSIIRPTSGAVETENSLRFNELCRFRQQAASVHRSQKEVEKEVLTAACNAVEFASRFGEI
jgi:hypothetical protein